MLRTIPLHPFTPEVRPKLMNVLYFNICFAYELFEGGLVSPALFKGDFLQFLWLSPISHILTVHSSLQGLPVDR